MIHLFPNLVAVSLPSRIRRFTVLGCTFRIVDSSITSMQFSSVPPTYYSCRTTTSAFHEAAAAHTRGRSKWRRQREQVLRGVG